MTYFSRYDREKLMKQLAQMSPEDIAALRDEGLSAEEREQQRQQRLRLPDSLGALRIYTGFADAAILVRIGPGSGEDGDPLEWQPLTTYRTKSVHDHQLHHDKLGEPLMTLSTEQMETMGLT